MSDIFISYAREDRGKAKALAELFQQQDWSVWWDRNIPPGRSFDEVIEEALGAAKCVVVLWSKNSASSDWVKGEAAEGLRRKILVPVRIDSANVPLEFRRLQTVDLSDWKGDAGHPELGGFLEAVAENIKSVVRQPPVTGIPRKRVKPALIVLGIVALLLAAGFAFYKFAAGGESGTEDLGQMIFTINELQMRGLFELYDESTGVQRLSKAYQTFEDAENLLTRAEKNAPGDIRLLELRGYMFKDFAMLSKEQSRPEDVKRMLANAEDTFNAVLKRRPSASAYNDLGNVYMLRGDLDQAEKWTRWALELVPDYGPAKQDLQHIEDLKKRNNPK
jgi:tetratricopeptide (TPR) repeat protein